MNIYLLPLQSSKFNDIKKAVFEERTPTLAVLQQDLEIQLVCLCPGCLTPSCSLVSQMTFSFY